MRTTETSVDDFFLHGSCLQCGQHVADCDCESWPVFRRVWEDGEYHWIDGEGRLVREGYLEKLFTPEWFTRVKESLVYS